MAHNNRSPQPAGSTSGNFAALALVFSFLFMGLVFVLSTQTPSEPEPVVTVVGRNLNYQPSPTSTATPTATFTPTATPTATRTPWPTYTPSITPTASPTAATANLAIQGERIFQSVCSACHGFNAQGVSGLGPSMIGNPFINGQSNADLQAFIMVGRPATDPTNKTGVQMPPRGGNPSLSDDDIMNVVHYIRSLNPGVPVVDGEGGATVVVATEIPVTREPVEEIEFKPLDLGSLLGSREATAEPDDAPQVTPTEDASASEPTPSTAAPIDPLAHGFTTGAASDYAFSCAGCHGGDGSGNIMTPALSESELLAQMNGIGLYEMLLRGIPTNGFAHPYRGGYPELTDEQILALIGYLYSLTDTTGE